jgi:hypothetical protein
MTEFDRIFRHFYFRDIANELAAAKTSDDAKAIFLDETDTWSDSYFKSGTLKSNRRLMFFDTSTATWFANAAKDVAPADKPAKPAGKKTAKKTSKKKTAKKKTAKKKTAKKKTAKKARKTVVKKSKKKTVKKTKKVTAKKKKVAKKKAKKRSR